MNGRRAFTLLELLVVLAVVGILIALAVVAIQRVRSAAACVDCGNRMKQICLACHAANDQNKCMPPAFGFYPGNNVYGGGDGLGTLFFHLLPFAQQLDLYQQARYQQGAADFYFYISGNVHRTQVPLFNCPADPTLLPGVDLATGYAPSSYAGNYLVFGNVNVTADFASANAQGTPRLGTSFPDGASNTILLAEKYALAATPRARSTSPAGLGYAGGCHWAYFQADCQNPFFAFFETGRSATDPAAVDPGGFQVQPSPARCNGCLPASGHSALNVCLADGSVRALAAGMSPQAWWALVTPAGGETVGD